MYHRVFSRIWQLLRPYIDKIEAEFDRGQLESVAEREAGEKELWEPIAASPYFSLSDRKHEASNRRFDSFDVDELDISESQFIQSFSETLFNTLYCLQLDLILSGFSSSSTAYAVVDREKQSRNRYDDSRDIEYL